MISISALFSCIVNFFRSISSVANKNSLKFSGFRFIYFTLLLGNLMLSGNDIPYFDVDAIISICLFLLKRYFKLFTAFSLFSISSKLLDILH